MAKEKITRTEYYQLIGLRTLAERLLSQLTEIDKAAEAITGQMAHTPDIISGYRDIDEGLKLMGITVEPPTEVSDAT